MANANDGFPEKGTLKKQDIAPHFQKNVDSVCVRVSQINNRLLKGYDKDTECYPEKNIFSNESQVKLKMHTNGPITAHKTLATSSEQNAFADKTEYLAKLNSDIKGDFFIHSDTQREYEQQNFKPLTEKSTPPATSKPVAVKSKSSIFKFFTEKKSPPAPQKLNVCFVSALKYSSDYFFVLNSADTNTGGFKVSESATNDLKLITTIDDAFVFLKMYGNVCAQCERMDMGTRIIKTVEAISNVLTYDEIEANANNFIKKDDFEEPSDSYTRENIKWEITYDKEESKFSDLNDEITLVDCEKMKWIPIYKVFEFEDLKGYEKAFNLLTRAYHFMNSSYTYRSKLINSIVRTSLLSEKELAGKRFNVVKFWNDSMLVYAKRKFHLEANSIDSKFKFEVKTRDKDLVKAKIMHEKDLFTEMCAVKEEGCYKMICDIALESDFYFLEKEKDIRDYLNSKPEVNKILVIFDNELLIKPGLDYCDCEKTPADCTCYDDGYKDFISILKSAQHMLKIRKEERIEVCLVDFMLHFEQIPGYSNAVVSSFPIGTTEDFEIAEQTPYHLDLNSRNCISFSYLNFGQNCQQLNLSRNFLTILDEYSFLSFKSNFRNISWLDLSRNFINKIKPRTFELMTNLTYLNLSFNSLRDIDAYTFKRNHLLYELNLEANRLERVHPLAFKNLKGLNILNLSSNMLYDLNSDQPNNVDQHSMFESCIRLTHLRLDNNCLGKLKSDQFSRNYRLSHLYLNNNRFTELPEKIFAKSRHLEILDLSSNKLAVLPKFFDLEENVSYFTELKALSLQSNNLTSISRSDFQGLTRLKVLFLHGNQISKLERECFDDLVKLRVLFLYDNHTDFRFEDGIIGDVELCSGLKKKLKKLSYLLLGHDLTKIRELVMLIRLKKYRNLIENETFQLRN